MRTTTVSERVARVFEIVGYIFLVPGALSMFFPLMFLIVSLAQPNIYGLAFGLIPLVIFGLGIFLLTRYYKHSRGLLDEDKILRLWFGTLAYNLMFLLPNVYGFARYFADNPYAEQTPPELSGSLIFYGLLLTWWTAAVCLSIGAILSEIKLNQKYL